MGLQSRGGRKQFYKSAVDFGGRKVWGGADLRENIAGSPLKANARQQTNRASNSEGHGKSPRDATSRKGLSPFCLCTMKEAGPADSCTERRSHYLPIG